MRELMEFKNKKLAATCILMSIIGILSIAAIDIGSEAKAVKISEISREIAGENILVCGTVKSKSISQSENAFLVLSEEKSSISVVFFKNEVGEVENISRGSKICVSGAVQTYNGTTEVIGRRALMEVYGTY